MSELQIKGKITELLTIERGESSRGDWQKQQFIIETPGDYPKNICLMVWGDKVDMLEKYKVGDNVIAHINIESREYNSRWYTDVKAWRMEKDDDAVSDATNDVVKPPEPPSNDSPASGDKKEEDDLPF